MERKLVNVAIANAFFEEKKNLMDTYYPFILKTFHNKTICSLNDISVNIKNLFDINFPINSIKNILIKNAKVFQISKVTKAQWNIHLSKDGQSELTSLIESENKAEKRLLSFYTFIKEFAAKEFEKSYEIETIRSLVDSFVAENIYSLSVEKIDKNGDKECSNEFEKIFIFCLTYLNSHNPEFIEIFDDIWKGTVIWNELKKDSFEDIDNKLKKHLEIYIDTNFALSLLGLHNPIINQAAKELLNLIQGIRNISLSVLDITLREIFDLLDLYEIIKDNFTDIEIDSVFYYLKHQGFGSVQIERLKDDLEDTLKSLGITKVESLTLVEKEHKTYATIYDHIYERRNVRNEKRSEIAKKKESAIEKSSHHDTSVILHVLREKDRFARNFESSKSIFLTSSFNLYRNYGKIHKKLESFPSVILDTTLTNILYLKNPQKSSQISLSQIIKTHCNYLIVDQNIWNSYLSIIKELKKEDKISVEDYTRLITKNQITQEFLLNVENDKIEEKEIRDVLTKINEEEKKIRSELSEKDSHISKLTTKNEELAKQKEHAESEIIEKEREQQEENKNLQGQIDQLKYESELKDYIEESLEKDFYPLPKKLILNVFVFVLVIFLFFLSDVVVSEKFILEHNLNTTTAYLIKAICSVILILLTALLTKIYKKEFWFYLKSKSSLKKELKKKYREEFKRMRK